MKFAWLVVCAITLPAEYLYVTFHDPGSSGVYFAISDDGHQWRTLNEGKRWLPPSHPGELMPKRMQAVRSTDLKHWSPAEVTFPEGSKHGSFIVITKEEARRLKSGPK